MTHAIGQINEIAASTHGHRVFVAPGGVTYVTFGGLCMTLQEIVAEFALLYIRTPRCP